MVHPFKCSELTIYLIIIEFYLVSTVVVSAFPSQQDRLGFDHGPEAMMAKW